MVEAKDATDLFNRNAALKKMSFLHRTFEIQKLGSQFSCIHHDFMPAIPAVNADSIVDLRSTFLILVSAILANEFQFNVHIVSENKRCANIITFFQISDQLGTSCHIFLCVPIIQSLLGETWGPLVLVVREKPKRKTRRKARKGRNPATGESIDIPAKTVVKMRIAKACKEAIGPPKGK